VAAGVAHGVFLASPAQASAPLWLKVLVIVMGLLIVAGFVVIAAEIARRMSTPNAGRPPTGTFSERIALPSGARVVSMTTAGDRLVVHVETQGGPAAAYIVDPRNGALLGTVEFPPGPTIQAFRAIFLQIMNWRIWFSMSLLGPVPYHCF